MQRRYLPHFLALSLSLAIFILYLIGSRSLGGGQPVMPVDDAYIHFQYAKQIAAGQPNVYNPGDAPTSGATSFLYPYLLAIGYGVGFQGLNLGYWAMAIGLFALITAVIAVYQIAVELDAPLWFALILMAAFALNGATAWHFMSGMETGLMMSFTLWVFYSWLTRRFRLFVMMAVLLALTRPEGSMMAVIAVVLYALEQRRVTLPLALPILASLVQPATNFLLTGSLSASGNQSKSLLGMIPAYPDRIIERIVGNFVRMWSEFIAGVGEHGILYLTPLLALLALIGLWRISRQQKRWTLLILVLAWLLSVSATVSTLDTAFWHFKRYQMPLMVLFFVLGAAAVHHNNRLRAVFAAPLLLVSCLSFATFYSYYLQNVQSVVEQPLAMAQWLRANTPEDSVIAVHDVGMIRYLGDRTTLDMVGLTTPDAADDWRSGPGAVGEYLTSVQPRPDYIAAYTTARGLNFLAQTGVYGDLLAGFTAEYDPRFNVALGGEFQGIFQPTWEGVAAANDVQQPSMLHYLEGLQLVDQVDVADLASENAHDYHWSNNARFDGFATEFYQQDYIDCALENCSIADGGRLITGEESFILDTIPNQDFILITRIHPINAGKIDIYVENMQVATRWIPAQPGQWLEIATLIPAEIVQNERTRIIIVPDIPGGSYMPYMHWAYQGDYSPQVLSDSEVTFQDGAIQMRIDYALSDDQRQLNGTILWGTQSGATGDYRLFIHVVDDPTQPPVAQAQDSRPGRGTLPPGNSLPGIFSDDFVVDLVQVPAGTYQVALGLYDPVTGERLLPASSNFEVDVSGRRVFVGQVRVDAR